MSPTWSQAFFSTSDPDHMNQVRVTGPLLPEPPELGVLPLVLLQAANTMVAAAAAITLVSRESRMALLALDVVVYPGGTVANRESSAETS
jgi:hypothetical protein